MESFRRFAVLALARDSSFVALAAFTSMVAFSFQPALALGVGANIALVYAVALIVRARLLTPQRISRIEAWRVLRDEQSHHRRSCQPREPDRAAATDFCQDLLLRCAKSSTTAAIVLAATSLVLHEGATDLLATPAQHAAVTLTAR
jgi:hypothetical protein